MAQYLALLRGINVGGNNIIKMADLKACFENMGYANVKTYIQSGNVIFSLPVSSGKKSAPQTKTTTKNSSTNTSQLESTLEQQLSKTFSYTSKVVVISKEQLQTAVKKAPPKFGTQPDTYRSDVMFLKAPLTPKEALRKVKEIEPKEGVDAVYEGPGVLYFTRLTSRATQSRLPKLVQKPVYKEMTIRNWNTTSKLLALMEETTD